jgi:hypothetical protein
MEVRIEWRSKAEGDDALLAVEEENETVLEAWPADHELLRDFLNDMVGLKPHARNGGDVARRFPDEWGDLVIARSESGDVLTIDPQLYWEGVAYWFRSRGDDPHPWRGHQ